MLRDLLHNTDYLIQTHVNWDYGLSSPSPNHNNTFFSITCSAVSWNLNRSHDKHTVI